MQDVTRQFGGIRTRKFRMEFQAQIYPEYDDSSWLSLSTVPDHSCVPRAK